MPIELRTQRDGKPRRHWYGRYVLDGRRHYLNLGVRILGTPPGSLSLREEGDAAFERSRAAAQAKLDAIVEETRTKRDSARLVEKIYAIKTGERLQPVKLTELGEAWLKIPRRRKPSRVYLATSQSVLRRFAEFIRRENPQIEELNQVSRGLAHLFLESEVKRGVSPTTWNCTMKLLRSTCHHLLPPGATNPFSGLPTKEAETVFRKPFSPGDLRAIVVAAESDSFIRPIIITGMCTAMRRGDCCLLQWKDVDLEGRFITVRTTKTRQSVSIPIFPMLYEELAARAGAKPQGNVFPDQAKMYESNPDGITLRVRKVMAAAGFRDPAEGEAKRGGAEGPTGGAKRTVPFRGEIHVERKEGLRRGSIRDFHSFRVTWVTLALTAGVPLELVQKVTGHRTTDIVLKHYFQPGREAFRQALHSAMPKLLMNGQKSAREQIREIVEGMTARTLKRDKERVLLLLGVSAERV